MQKCPECNSLNVSKFCVEWHKTNQERYKMPQQETYKTIYLLWFISIVTGTLGLATDNVIVMIISLGLVIFGWQLKLQKDVKNQSYPIDHKIWLDKYICKNCNNEFIGRE